MSMLSKSLLIGLAATIIFFFLYDSLIGEKRIRNFKAKAELQFRADPDLKYGYPERKIKAVLAERMNNAGYDYDISLNSPGHFVIEVYDVIDTTKIHGLFTTNHIQFWEAYRNTDLINLLNFLTDNEDTSINGQKNRDTVVKLTELLVPPAKKENRFLELIELSQIGNPEGYAEIGKVNVNDTAELLNILQSKEAIKRSPLDAKFLFGFSQGVNAKGEKDQHVSLYCIRTHQHPDIADIEGDNIRDAQQEFDKNGAAIVNFSFDSIGTRKWAAMTLANINRSIAMIIDNKVLCAPNVLSEVTGGTTTLTGSYKIQEADILALMIRGPRLPANARLTSLELTGEKGNFFNKKSLMLALLFVLISGTAFFVLKTVKTN